MQRWRFPQLPCPTPFIAGVLLAYVGALIGIRVAKQIKISRYLLAYLKADQQVTRATVTREGDVFYVKFRQDGRIVYIDHGATAYDSVKRDTQKALAESSYYCCLSGEIAAGRTLNMLLMRQGTS